VPERIEAEAIVRAALADVLGLKPRRAEALAPSTPLFGAMPELDSMAAANLLGELEDRLGIVFERDDIDAGMFDTFGTLVAAASARMGS